MTVFHKVNDFNEQVVGIRRSLVQHLSADEKDWLLGVLREEIDELELADALVDQVDALIDVIYFAIGGMKRLGLSVEQMEQCFNVVHTCNMRKHQGKKAERAQQHSLDAVKPENWIAPEEQLTKILSR